MLGVGDAGQVLNYLKQQRSSYYEAVGKEKHVMQGAEIFGIASISPSANLELREEDWGITDAQFAQKFGSSENSCSGWSDFRGMLEPGCHHSHPPFCSSEEEEKRKGETPAVKVVSFDELKKYQNSFVFKKERTGVSI